MLSLLFVGIAVTLIQFKIGQSLFACSDRKATCGHGMTAGNRATGYLCCIPNGGTCPAGFTSHPTATWTAGYPTTRSAASRCPPNANHDICVSPGDARYQDLEVLTIPMTSRRKNPCPDNHPPTYQANRGTEVTLDDHPLPHCPNPVTRRNIEHSTGISFQCKGKGRQDVLWYHCTKPTGMANCPAYQSTAKSNTVTQVTIAADEPDHPCRYVKDCKTSNSDARNEYVNAMIDYYYDYDIERAREARAKRLMRLDRSRISKLKHTVHEMNKMN